MKKLYVVLLIVLLTPIAVYAWNDCPYGLLNDPFPGQCPRYTDTNQNNICDHSESPGSTTLNNSSTTQQTRVNDSNGTVSDVQEASSVPAESYNLIPLATTTLILYLVSYLLYLEDRLKRNMFYNIWKYVLIASFVLTGVTGLILVIFVNYGIQTSWNLTIDFWHAEFAIVMAVSTLLHFHLYWKQVKKIFRV
jgi:hypothetical protein